MELRHCTVYQGRGERALALDDTTPDGFLMHQEKTSLHDIMCRDLVCARSDLEIGAVADLMVKHHIGCMPIVDEERKPIGMITELDIVELLDTTISARRRGAPLPPEIATIRADQVMMPVALALDEYTQIGQAASLMLAEELHHVLAVAWNGALVGVVSAKDMVAWFIANDEARAKGARSFSTWHALEG
jgi:CBS-domain-containing membrane protein